MNLTLHLRFVFSCTQPRSKFLACRIHRLVCVYPNQVQRFHARISALLHWNNLVDTFRMYPISLFMSRSQHKIFGQIPTVDTIPEFSSFLQDLIVRKRISGTGPAISSTEFSCSLSFSCSRRKIRVQQRSLHLRIQPVSLPNFLCKTVSKAILVLHLFVKKPVVFRTYSLDSDRIF